MIGEAIDRYEAENIARQLSDSERYERERAIDGVRSDMSQLSSRVRELEQGEDLSAVRDDARQLADAHAELAALYVALRGVDRQLEQRLAELERLARIKDGGEV